jgi:hypothetical protein
MHQAMLLYPWFKKVAKAFADLSKPQSFLLAAFSFGIVRAQRCTLARIAERLCSLGKADTVERRLQRFLANPKISLEEGCRCLAGWVLSSLVFGGKTLVLLVDETSLAEHLKVMAVSLAYRGRAIPLAWWCYHPEHYPMKSIELIDTLLGWVAPWIPAGCRVLVEADRGLGSSPALARRLRQRGFEYLVRVTKQMRLRLPDQQEVQFGSLVQGPGQHWSGPVQAFGSEHWQSCWAIIYWGQGHKEPWLLLTSWAEVPARGYGWRMWEELAFRDFKSYGWHWDRSRVWEPEHANRLWLAMALAYAWTISLGTQAVQAEVVRREVVRGKAIRRSLVAVGIRVLRRADELRRHIVTFFDFLFLPTDLAESVVQ